MVNTLILFGTILTFQIGILIAFCFLYDLINSRISKLFTDLDAKQAQIDKIYKSFGTVKRDPTGALLKNILRRHK